MIRKKITLALLMLFPLISHSTPFIYVADYGNQQVAIIDAATNMVTPVPMQTILNPSPMANPYCIAVAPNGTTTCAGVNQFATTGLTQTYAITLAIIDNTSSMLISNPTIIPSINAPLTANCVAYTTDSSTVYIGCSTGDIFPVTNLTGTPSVGAAFTVVSGQPIDIAIANTSNGETAYIVTDSGAIYYALTSNNIPIQINTAGIAANSLTSIAILPNSTTAYALGTDSTNGFIYTIDTSSNTVTNILSPIMIPSESNPTGITTDGTYLYVTGAGNNDLYIIPINNPAMITTIDISSSGSPQCLTLTQNASGAIYIDIGFDIGNVNSYPAPSGSPAGTPIALGGSIRNNSIAALPITPTPSLLPPASVNGCKTKNVFLLQTDYINNITWTAPASGSPAAYAIYRDVTLTQLVSIVPATGPLQYYDHDRNPNVTYTYYIVSVDASGNQSAPASVTVTQNC